jgi:hypothetical protein
MPCTTAASDTAAAAAAAAVLLAAVAVLLLQSTVREVMSSPPVACKADATVRGEQQMTVKLHMLLKSYLGGHQQITVQHLHHHCKHRSNRILRCNFNFRMWAAQGSAQQTHLSMLH